ncbi:MAG: hypothetical protein ABEJ24_05020, partial [Candidatus Magasanikbacteria bacterium]
MLSGSSFLKTVFLSLFLLVFVFILDVSVVESKSVPQFMNFEGQLTDSNGNRIDKKQDLTFRIYTKKTGGKQVFKTTHNNVDPKNGYFSVVLGSNKKLELDFEQRYWVSVEVGSDGEMDPRLPISTVG